MTASYLVGFIGAVFWVAGFVQMPLVWIVIGLYYDKKFKSSFNPLQKGNLLPKGLMRAGQYSILVLFGKGMRKSYDRMVFGDYDFRKDARLIDKIVAYMFWCSFASGIILAVISMILKAIGY